MFQTRYGDANLDGRVTIADFNAMAQGFNQAGVWATGDFNGDGLVTIADFNLLAANFNASGPAAAAQLAELRAFAAVVPEPGTLMLAISCGILLHCRRRTLS